ncbi:MFS transporter [Streptomyces iconiensis]|uniref:MFS transporter n=1 Tax=Streptomyces iconiensis TaxID=1384038 RepID=A0ABT6ZXJ4_9ACTN|nr:MFS transporter [Streptomyces iconiensis]MDJ1133790.1 MFS transporter [Streptomyces iconiensis]
MNASRWRALSVLSLLQFLIAIDVTVVNVALPSIGAELGAAPASLTWVVTGYTLAGGGLLLLGGRICDLFGRRRMFLLGTLLFGLSSLLAGVAEGLPALLAARLGQGAGEALASPAAMSLIALLFPRAEERAKALGVWGGISSMGLVGGVLMSGLLTELLHWRWIFYVNVPLVALVLMLTPVFVRADTAPEDGAPKDAARKAAPARKNAARKAPARKDPAAEKAAGTGVRKGPRVDLPGAALLTAGPLALVYGVVRATDHAWTSPGVLLPLCGGLLALAGFVRVEARTRRPLVPLAFFANRTRTAANAATVLLSAALSSTFFLATLYMQHVLGMGPLHTGLAYLPFCAALLLTVTVVGRIIGVLGVRGTAVAGLLCAAAGGSWLATLPAEGNLWKDVVPGMVAMAVGMALGLIALQNAALSGVTEDDAGLASGVQRSVDQLGGALGLAILVGLALGSAGEAAGYRTAFGWATLGVLVAVPLVWTAVRVPARAGTTGGGTTGGGNGDGTTGDGTTGGGNGDGNDAEDGNGNDAEAEAEAGTG